MISHPAADYLIGKHGNTAGGRAAARAELAATMRAGWGCVSGAAVERHRRRCGVTAPLADVEFVESAAGHSWLCERCGWMGVGRSSAAAAGREAGRHRERDCARLVAADVAAGGAA